LSTIDIYSMSSKNFRLINKIGTLTMHPHPPKTYDTENTSRGYTHPQFGRPALGLHKPPELGVKFLIDMTKNPTYLT
jgi:hypothetical protein